MFAEPFQKYTEDHFRTWVEIAFQNWVEPSKTAQKSWENDRHNFVKEITTVQVREFVPI
jgi:hypothetical protein